MIEIVGNIKDEVSKLFNKIDFFTSISWIKPDLLHKFVPEGFRISSNSSWCSYINYKQSNFYWHIDDFGIKDGKLLMCSYKDNVQVSDFGDNYDKIEEFLPTSANFLNNKNKRDKLIRDNYITPDIGDVILADYKTIHRTPISALHNNRLVLRLFLEEK